VAFEFIPEGQWEAEHPKTLLATEVKVGEHYRILMTNYSGFVMILAMLWRFWGFTRLPCSYFATVAAATLTTERQLNFM